MISFEDVTIRYSDSAQPALREVNLQIAEGELCLVVGRTGTGKSTLLGAINGLVPHFTGGTLSGRVSVDGRDTRTHLPRHFADLVGVVGQDPRDGFVTDTVEEELAYGMEQLAIDPSVMRKRVEETLDLLGLAPLRRRPLVELSGGQQQRVAIGAVLTAHPKVLVLDEPTSALDPTAAEEVLAAITRLVHDLGVTVVLAEHRLERVVQYADQLVQICADGRVRSSDPRHGFTEAEVAPPVVELGQLAGWQPLPLSVRDARRQVSELRERMADVAVPPARPDAVQLSDTQPETLLRAHGLQVRYGSVVAVRDVELSLQAGQITALMGRNGCGKSSLLWALQGSGPRHAGTVDVSGVDPARCAPKQRRAVVALVPQTPADLLYLESVADELAAADAEAGDGQQGHARALLEEIAPGIPDATHPRDLSEGQRLSLALAVQLRSVPGVLMLDEPTRGLDYRAKNQLRKVLDRLAAAGCTVLVSTHDVEFVAAAADRVIVMAEGEIVAVGPTSDVIVSSPAFAPQTAKILAPLPYLTVDQLRRALVAQ